MKPIWVLMILVEYLWMLMGPIFSRQAKESERAVESVERSCQGNDSSMLPPRQLQLLSPCRTVHAVGPCLYEADAHLLLLEICNRLVPSSQFRLVSSVIVIAVDLQRLAAAHLMGTHGDP